MIGRTVIFICFIGLLQAQAPTVTLIVSGDTNEQNFTTIYSFIFGNLTLFKKQFTAIVGNTTQLNSDQSTAAEIIMLLINAQDKIFNATKINRRANHTWTAYQQVFMFWLEHDLRDFIEGSKRDIANKLSLLPSFIGMDTETILAEIKKITVAVIQKSKFAQANGLFYKADGTPAINSQIAQMNLSGTLLKATALIFGLFLLQ